MESQSREVELIWEGFVQSGMKRNLAFSFSSWFCVPELGMKDFEILCRASCFIVPTITPKVKRPYSM